MNLLELFLIAVAVSMDAFAVAICKGISMKKVTVRKAGTVGLYFGLFQAGMPLIGYLLGVQFKTVIISIDHWIAFALLGLIGITMIKESKTNECESCSCNDNHEETLNFKNMSTLAVATSIDALAVGVTFALLNVNIIPAVSFIGIITLSLSMAGVKIGHTFGSLFKSKAELAGGLALILMGIKILLEHTGILAL